MREGEEADTQREGERDIARWRERGGVRERERRRERKQRRERVEAPIVSHD